MSLELIMGPMFSGKTTELCRQVRRLRHTTASVLVVNHSSDVRYGAATETRTHDNLSCASFPAPTLGAVLGTAAYHAASVVFVNEAQFFDDLVDFCVTAVETDGKHVVAVGLDGDYERKPFGQILRLVPLADRVQKLTAVCHFCADGTPAIFSRRTTAHTTQVLVGDNRTYVPVCRAHYHIPQSTAPAVTTTTGTAPAVAPAAAPA
jgi:thymidine kinase